MSVPGRVLHIGKAYPPWIGGIERHIADVSAALVKRGWHVDVLVAGSGRVTSTEVRDGVHIYRLGHWGNFFSQPFAPGYLRASRRLAAQADVVHLHVPNPMGQLATRKWIASKPLAVTWHSDIVRQRAAAPLLIPMERHCLRQAGAAIATSPNYAESSPRLREFADKVEVIPMGLDLAEMDARLESAKTSAERIVAEAEGPVVLCVARLVPYKGVEFLVRAMPHFDARVRIVGGGPLRSRLCALAGQLGVAERLHIESDLNDFELAARYRSADIFVLPSMQRSEAFGIVQLEAFAARLPVISTNLSTGVPWVNRDGESGIVVEPGRAGPLAGAIRRLLADKELRIRLGQGGRKRLETDFQMELVVSQLEAVYTRIRPAEGGDDPALDCE